MKSLKIILIGLLLSNTAIHAEHLYMIKVGPGQAEFSNNGGSESGGGEEEDEGGSAAMAGPIYRFDYTWVPDWGYDYLHIHKIEFKNSSGQVLLDLPLSNINGSGDGYFNGSALEVYNVPTHGWFELTTTTEVSNEEMNEICITYSDGSTGQLSFALNLSNYDLNTSQGPVFEAPNSSQNLHCFAYNML